MDKKQKIFRDTAENIRAWTPPTDKEKASESLHSFLSERTNIGKDGFKKKEKTVSVERKEGLTVIDDSSAVMLVEYFSVEDGERVEEIVDSSSFEYIIIAAYGVSDVEAWRGIEEKYRGTRGRGVQVDFVWKEEQFFGEDTY